MDSQEKFAKENDPRLRKWLRSKGLSKADADDAAQDSWLAFLGGSRFDGRSSASTYLFGIGKNKIRERQRAREHGELDHDIAGGAPSPEGVMRDAEGFKRIQECLDDLPAAQKRAIEERAFEEKDVGVIAKKLKTTANNVSVLLHRARAYLSSCIHEH